MRNRNWQNPYTLIENTPGTYSFWPASIYAEAVDVRRVIEFSVKIDAPEYEPLIHFFNIPVVSSINKPFYSTDKNTKLPDLFLFRPNEEQDW